jgi:deoxyribodipyrimidine photo-lyase
MSADWTPFARAREAAVRAWCGENGASFVLDGSDVSLVDPRAMEKPYLVFGAVARHVRALGLDRGRRPADASPSVAEAPPPAGAKVTSRLAASTAAISAARAVAERHLAGAVAAARRLCGGRAAALRKVRRVATCEFGDYDASRDALWLPEGVGTTGLSAYIKFGCVGPWEVLEAVLSAHGPGHGLVNQLLWRAFYEQLAFWNPGVLRGQVQADGRRRRGGGNEALRGKFDGPWRPARGAAWDAWCAGRTGVPLVDAGMRQLLATGRMHNRARMVAASFLVKDLGIDWRAGERFFARHLVDYDPCVNSGNWQWVAGCGCDPRRATRRFSPWRQARRYDPEARYIKRWVPELRELPPAVILGWDVAHVGHAGKAHGYPRPMLGNVSK